jgi:hypothetical protein
LRWRSELKNVIEIEVPSAPAGLPQDVREKWEAAYADAFRKSQPKGDYSDMEISRQHTEAHHARRKADAIREANRILHTPELTSYAQAMSLEAWHFVLREPSGDGKTLRVVTRHGKKYYFPIPDSRG